MARKHTVLWAETRHVVATAAVMRRQYLSSLCSVVAKLKAQLAGIEAEAGGADTAHLLAYYNTNPTVRFHVYYAEGEQKVRVFFCVLRGVFVRSITVLHITYMEGIFFQPWKLTVRNCFERGHTCR